MPEMQIKVVGLQDLIFATGKAANQFAPEFKAAMSKSVLIVEAEAKSLASGRGAKFQRSIHSQVRGMGATVKGIVGTNDKRGKWFEFGTGIYHEPDAHQPWTIVAKNRFALAIPMAKGTPGASAQWAVRDMGPFSYQRMTDAKGRNLFRTPKGGSTYKEGGAQGVIFRKSVTIKGMRPRPWLMQAFKNKRQDVEAVFRATLVDINRRLSHAARHREAGD